MLQLSDLDTAFLNMETNITFGHAATLMLFDGTGFRGSNPYAAIRSHFEACARRLPPLYRRLVEVPFGLDRPYWIDEGEVDIDFHVRHIGVPPPGNTAQLAELIAHLDERPLDRNRPLWDLHVIEGLASNEVALLFKTLHAAADGASSMVMFSEIFSTRPDPAPPPHRELSKAYRKPGNCWHAPMGPCCVTRCSVWVCRCAPCARHWAMG